MLPFWSCSTLCSRQAKSELWPVYAYSRLANDIVWIDERGLHSGVLYMTRIGWCTLSEIVAYSLQYGGGIAVVIA
jgi:hypothetical protein